MLQTALQHWGLSGSPQGSAPLGLFGALAACPREGLLGGFGGRQFSHFFHNSYTRQTRCLQTPLCGGPADRQKSHTLVPSNPLNLSVKISPLVKTLQQLQSVLLVHTHCRQRWQWPSITECTCVIKVHKCSPSCNSPACVSTEFRLTVAATESMAIFAPSKSEVERHKLTLPREFVAPVALNKKWTKRQRSLGTAVPCWAGVWGIIFQIKMPTLSLGRIWKGLRPHRPSSDGGKLSRMLSSLTGSREPSDEQLQWLASFDSTDYQGLWSHVPWTCSRSSSLGSDCLRFSTSTAERHRTQECLGFARGSAGESPPAALRDGVRWDLLCPGGEGGRALPSCLPKPSGRRVT